MNNQGSPDTRGKHLIWKTTKQTRKKLGGKKDYVRKKIFKKYSKFQRGERRHHLPEKRMALRF